MKSRLVLSADTKRNLAAACLAFACNKVFVIILSAIGVSQWYAGKSFLGKVRLVLVGNFLHWDATQYTAISKSGYQTVKATAFFPGYPLAIRTVSWVTHMSALTAGVLISNILFLLFLYFFIKLALLDYDWAQSRRALLLLAFYPMAYYFSGAYTESMFMLVSVLALLAMRRQQWSRAGVWGMIAAVTRNTGVLLGLPYLIEYYSKWRQSGSGSRRVKFWPVLWVVMIGIGVAAYMGYLWAAKGDPLSFIHQQKNYGRGTGTPWGTLYRGYRYGFDYLIHPRLGWTYVYYVTEMFFPALVIVVLITSFRKIRWSYWVMILYSLIVPLFGPANAAPDVHSTVIDYFVSFSRYSLVIVPLYFGLARLLRNRWAFRVYLALSIIFLMIFTFAWSRHAWVA